jgi:dienelactone hydrolase
MMIRTQDIDYRDEDTLCKGVLAYDDARPGPLPGVLISHMWAGREEFVEGKALELAKIGYAAFALDMYGEGRRGRTPDECRALMQPFVEDRELLTRRITAALRAMRSLERLDARRIAALGFCFGGMCVLDLARSGADIRGVVSMHGLLKAHDLPKTPIVAKVLALHGNEDPLAPVEDVLAFQEEMTAAGADWQVHVYGGVRHAFTNPNAANPEAGLMYNPVAERRAWAALLDFLTEVLR